MASALECWSSRTSTDEDMVDQVLMKTQDRSEAVPVDSAARPSKESSVVQKKLQKLSRNVAEAITTVKNSLNLDSVREPPATKVENSRELLWCGVVRNLTQLYPGSQLPEKLVSNIRKHFDSLPIRYAQAGFDMKEVFLHIKLIEQAEVDDYPAILIQELAEEDTQRCTLKLTFACNSSISWLTLSEALDKVVICCKKIQIFENKGFTLGVILVLVQSGQEKQFKIKIESALKSALKKPKPATVMLSFGLCGCQEENNRGREIVETDDEKDEQNYGIGVANSNPKFQLPNPLPESSYIVSVDEWQTIRSGGDEIGKWLLNSDQIEFLDQLGPTTFKGIHKGKRVSIERIKGCEKGCSYEFQVRRDLLELMICGHRNILEFHGVCIEETHGLCVVTKMKEGGSVQEIIQKNKKLQTREVIRIAIDVAEGMKFMNDHGVAYRDLNSQKILLDRQGHACLGDMGLVTACKSIGEAMDYETDGHRWLAPEIIAGDPESVTETWMSNVYSFGMVVWEMVTGEAAYAAYSPVQAAVGIAACGLRPEIPKDCPQLLRSLMMKCWNDCPSKRPQLSEILGILMRANSANTSTNTNHR